MQWYITAENPTFPASLAAVVVAPIIIRFCCTFKGSGDYHVGGGIATTRPSWPTWNTTPGRRSTSASGNSDSGERHPPALGCTPSNSNSTPLCKGVGGGIQFYKGGGWSGLHGKEAQFELSGSERKERAVTTQSTHTGARGTKTPRTTFSFVSARVSPSLWAQAQARARARAPALAPALAPETAMA